MQKQNTNLKISFIITLVIPALISGPLLPELLVSISSIVFLIFIFKKKKFLYLKKKPVSIFFLFCLYCILLSIFIAEDTLLSFESSLFYFRIGLFACLIWYLIEIEKKILSFFYYSLIICFSTLVIDGYIQYFTGYNVLGFPKSGARISSFFGDELIMGSYLARLFPLLFALFVIKKTRKYELYFIGLLFVMTDILIYLSGERASFFFLNLSTIFIIILVKKYQKFRVITFIIALIFLVFISLTNPLVKDRMITQTKESMGLLSNSEKKYIFTPAHDSLIRTAINMFIDKPIFGHGPKMFRVICKDEKYSIGVSPCMTHPHNFYVQLLAETGIFGCLFLICLLVCLIYYSLKHLKTIVFKQKRFFTDYQVCLLAGILITIWPFTSNGNFFNNWLSICYSLPIGFFLHSIYGKNKDTISI